MKQKIFILSLIVLFLAFSIKAIPSYNKIYFSCDVIYSNECILKSFRADNQPDPYKISEYGIKPSYDSIDSRESVEAHIQKQLKNNSEKSVYEKIISPKFINEVFSLN